jgi:hypothetical protein
MVAGEPGVASFAVVVDGKVIGVPQHWEQDDPATRHEGIDLALRGDHQGRGLGTDVVRTLAGTSSGSAGITESRSTRRPTTRGRSAATRRSASGR